MNTINSSVSALKLEKFYFSQFEFSRDENFDSFSGDEIEIGFGKNTSVDGNILNITVFMRACYQDLFELKLAAVGKFNCQSDDISAIAFEKNAIAIMFPYIRSQITLLTSQPNLKPIVLPPININALFEKLQEDNKNE